MDAKGKERGILKMDSRTKINIDTSKSELTPQVSIEQGLSSPQPSVDRLSVTWAEPGSMTSSGVNLFHLPSETPVNNEVTFSPSAGEGSEDEDYSASLSAVLRQRRASVRRSRKGRARRPSSPLLPDDGRLRRRSSAFTTSSGDTAISIEDVQQTLVTQEQIFENIHLHKEVLGSVKQQPLGLRRKLKIVHQAKAYIKRHEGELQERLAQSKSTRDIYARFNILLAAKWQQLKREAANTSNLLIPWELRIKEIESHFGSVVASYFTFLRWLFWVNLVIGFILLVFVIVPEYLTANPQQDGERKIIMEDERRNATNLLTLWEFEGILKYSPIFYGYYSNLERPQYRMPLAYFLTGLVVYIYSFVATLRKMAENSRMSKLSEKEDECIFSWKLFTGWDFMIGNTETAHNRIASVILGFKEALLEEAEKKRDLRNWRIIGLRLVVNICVIILLAVSAYAVVYVVSDPVDNTKARIWWRENQTTIVVTVITTTFPVFFELLGFLEHYHPRKQLRLQLARIMLLNLLNLYSLIFALFSKIGNMSKELDSLQPTLYMNATTISNNTLNMTAAIVEPMLCFEQKVRCEPCNFEITIKMNEKKREVLSPDSRTNPSISYQFTTTRNSNVETHTKVTDAATTLTPENLILEPDIETSTLFSRSIQTEDLTEIIEPYASTKNTNELVITTNGQTNVNIEKQETTTLDSILIARHEMEKLRNVTLLHGPITIKKPIRTVTEIDDYNYTYYDFSSEKLFENNTDIAMELSTANYEEYTMSKTINIEDYMATVISNKMDSTDSTADTNKYYNINNIIDVETDYTDSYFPTESTFVNFNTLVSEYEPNITLQKTITEMYNYELNKDETTSLITETTTEITDEMSFENETTDGYSKQTEIDDQKSTTSKTTDENSTIIETTYRVSATNDEESIITDQKSVTSEITNRGLIDYIDITEAINQELLTTENTDLETITSETTHRESIITSNRPLETDIIEPESTTTEDEPTTIFTDITTINLKSSIETLTTNEDITESTLDDATDFTSMTSTISSLNTVVICPNITFNCTTNCNGENVTQVLFMSNCTVVNRICYVTRCENSGNTSEVLRNLTDTTVVDTVYEDQSNRKMYNLTVATKKKLLKLCWETMFGQELVKLTMMDLVFVLFGTLFMDFFRALFVRYMNRCWCWDLEKKFPEYGDFKIAENILHLINNQGMVWMGMFFSPGLVVLNVVKLMIMMYLRSWAVMTCNVPHEVVFRVSKSNNFYLALLLTMLFLCVLPVGYTIVWVKPSWHCGPFSEYDKIYQILTKNIDKLLPDTLNFALEYMASPAIIIPLLVLLILIIYYLTSLTNSLREANNDLKIQLRRERTEERRKMFQLADNRRRAGSSAMENTPFARWKKALPTLPLSKSIDSEDRRTFVGEVAIQPLKSIKKRGGIFAKIVGMALDKKSDVEAVSENNDAPLSPTNLDEETDTDFHETLPKEVLKAKDITVIKHPNHKKQNSVEFKTNDDNRPEKRKIEQTMKSKQEKFGAHSEKKVTINNNTNDVTKDIKSTHVSVDIPETSDRDNKMLSKKQISESSTQSKQSDSVGSVIPVITISTTESDEELLTKGENDEPNNDENKTNSPNLNRTTVKKSSSDLKSLQRQSSVDSINENKKLEEIKPDDGHKYQYSL